MRRANLGNMFAPLLASGWINQLDAQTPSPTANAKIGKVFHETCQPPLCARGHNDFFGALRRLLPYKSLPHAGLSRFVINAQILRLPWRFRRCAASNFRQWSMAYLISLGEGIVFMGKVTEMAGRYTLVR